MTILNDAARLVTAHESLLNDAARIVALVDAFDRDCEAAQYTDSGDAWAVLANVTRLLRPYLTAEQSAELERQRVQHESEIAQAAELDV